MSFTGQPGFDQPGFLQPGVADAPPVPVPPPTGAWAATRTETVSDDGDWAIQWTAEADGDIVDPGNLAADLYIPAVAGQSYVAVGEFQAATVSRDCQVGLAFYDDTKTQIGTTIWGNPVLDTAGMWTDGQDGRPYATVALNAPAGTAWVSRPATAIIGALTGEVHYGDKFGIFATTGIPAWTLGGFATTGETIQIQASDDGANWTDLPGASALVPEAGQAVIVDYWAPNGTIRYYQARVLSTAYGQPVASPWQQVTGFPLPNDQWWLVDPTEPSLDDLGYGAVGVWRMKAMSAMTASGASVSLEEDEPEDQGVFTGVGRKTATVVRGEIRNEYPTSLAFAFGAIQDPVADDNYQLYRQLRNRQRTLLVKSDMPGKFYYLAILGSRPVELLRTGDRKTNPLRTMILSTVPVDPPVVSGVPLPAGPGGSITPAPSGEDVDGGTL